LFGDKIKLVASQSDDDIFIGLSLKFLDPRFGFVKGGLRELVRPIE
jgi:hypothetical protein